ARAGMTRDAAREALASPESRDATLSEAAAMARAGVQGVPTFIVNERTGFSGALPPATLTAALRKAGGA
ncbi:MAG: DsbA family protein, partial [Amphiplicatus sp.]